MAWTAKNFRVWKVCWAWIIPYPCRRTVTKYCCRGVHKYRTFIIFVVEHYFCCDRHEHHWWSFDFSLNLPTWVIHSDAEVCKGSRPEESEGCPEAGVGDAPSVGVPPGPGQQALVQVGGSASAGAIIAALVAALATGDAQQAGVAALAGAIVGAVFGAGTGRRWGCAATLVVLLIVLVFLWLIIRFR